jgi:hypothetical protein
LLTGGELALSGKHHWSQYHEMLLPVLTHNIATILLLKELFYRAERAPLFSPKMLSEIAARIIETELPIRGLWRREHGKGPVVPSLMLGYE